LLLSISTDSVFRRKHFVINIVKKDTGTPSKTIRGVDEINLLFQMSLILMLGVLPVFQN